MYLPVANFYAGKSIFLTGGTGFLGKVLIEKLLYSCTDIEKIYVLVRSKKGYSAKKRIQDMKELPLFTRLKKERFQDLGKIVPIAGDIAVPKLGISKEDEQTLLDKVSITFHTAASVKFDDPLDVAINQNLDGTRHVLDLCRHMKNSQAFVHISTAFCHPNREVIEERVYPPPAALSDVYSHMKKYGDNEDNLKELLNGQANTYTFAKALAETLVAESHGHVPTAIIRPSIVSATYHEPFKGWVDSWSASSLMLVFVAKGLIRTQMGHKDFITDVIPVDYVSNLSIVAASRCASSDEVTVYNCCSSEEKPISCDESFRMFTMEGLQHNFNILPMPGSIFVDSNWMKFILMYALEAIPAYVIDCFYFIRGKKQRFVKLNKKASALRELCEPFIARSWLMTSQRTRTLASSLAPSDQKTFRFNPADIVWKEYVPIHFHGVTRYLMNRDKKKFNKEENRKV